MMKNVENLMYNLYSHYTKKPIAYVKRHLMKSSKDDVYMLAVDVIKHNIADGLFTDYNQLETFIK